MALSGTISMLAMVVMFGVSDRVLAQIDVDDSSTGVSCVQVSNASFTTPCPCGLATMSFTVTGETSVVDNVVNIAVVLDGSGSIGEENFNVSKEFAKNITAAFAKRKLFANGGTASYVQFGSFVSDDDTGTFYSLEDFNEFVDDDVYLDSFSTNIDAGVIAGREILNAAPLASASFMIFLTDGDDSEGDDNVQEEADDARADSITLFAVGVGSSVSNDTLLAIGGSYDNVFRVYAFEDLEDVMDEILASSEHAIECPAPNAELTVEYGATVVSITSHPRPILDDTVRFHVSDLEDNPTDFIVILGTCVVFGPVVPVVSITYSDDEGNFPDFTPVLNVADGSTCPPATSPPTSSPTPSVTSFMTFSPSSSPTSIVAPGTCSNGLVGISGDGQCCVLECGQCLESGCKARTKSAGLTTDDCCPNRISNAGLYCDVSGSAPCTIRNLT